MSAIDTLREKIPDAAKDIRLNLGAVLKDGPLSPAQRWGVAIASAHAARNAALTQAILADARAELGEGASAVEEDARAAAALMAMNNVYYRFRHMMGKDTYEKKPARLRMMRLVQVTTNKADFELFSMAVSAINGCEACVQAHEHAVLEGGLTEDHVHDAVRIAATVHAAAVALELSAAA